MPPISKVDIDLEIKSCSPTTTMGFCQQNQKPQEKGKSKKGLNQSDKGVCSSDPTTAIPAGLSSGEDKLSKLIMDDILLASASDSCKMSPFETDNVATALVNQSSDDSGNHSQNDLLLDSEQSFLGPNDCGKKEATCGTISSTCSSLSSLTVSDIELGSLNDNTAEVNVNKKLTDQNSNNAAVLKTNTEDSAPIIIKDDENIIIQKENGKEAMDQKETSEVDDVSLKDFSFMQLLGKGAFGHVVLASKNTEPDPNVYALKMIPKNAIEENKNYQVHFRSERQAMELVRGGRFLPKLHYAFQTLDHLYLVMDFASGGQLLHQFIGKNVLFENHMRVYLAELLVAVDFLHNRGIVHRDIKPENILLDKTGHVVLIDFGLCRVSTDPPCQAVVGTQPYIAPEILRRQPHDRMADFWSLGVLGYEMVTGETPFSLDLSDDQLKKAVLEKEPWFPTKLFHKPCKALLSGLMHKNPKQRLGAINKASTSGMKGVMAHKFFKCIDWAVAERGGLKPPSIPERFICPKKKPLAEPKDSGFRCHFEGYSYSWLRSGEGSS